MTTNFWSFTKAAILWILSMGISVVDMHFIESSNGEQSRTCLNDVQLSPSSLQLVVKRLWPLCSKLNYLFQTEKSSLGALGFCIRKVGQPDKTAGWSTMSTSSEGSGGWMAWLAFLTFEQFISWVGDIHMLSRQTAQKCQRPKKIQKRKWLFIWGVVSHNFRNNICTVTVIKRLVI